MDISSFSRDGMSGTARRYITNYGRDPIGPCRWEHPITKPHTRWHSGEGYFKESRDSSDAIMAWEGESAYEKSQKKSYRSRSRSPIYRFDRASVNDRLGRITTYNFRNDKPRSTSTIPCKFFATGNCRNGSSCRFSHNDRTLDSLSNYKADQMQGIDSRIYRASPRALDINVSPRVVSESRGTATRGADIEGSMTSTQNHLPTLNGTSRRPDVLDTTKSEAASSNQFQMGSEPISRLTNTLVQLLEDGKQLPELYAAVSALNSLGLMEYILSASAGPDVPASSSNQYDPVTDSLELVKSIVSEQTSQLLLTGTPGGDGLHRIDCNKAEWNVNRRPDVLDTAKPEAASSNQFQMGSEPISHLTNTLVQLLEDGKQLPELCAAVNALNALGLVQYFLSASAGPDVPASSSNQYDPVTDSLELVKYIVSEQTSQLILTGTPGGDGLHRIDCNKAEWNVNSLQSTENALLADCKNEEQKILMDAEMKEGKGKGKLANNEEVGKAAEMKKNSDEKNLQTSGKAPVKKGQDRGKLVNNEGDAKADEKKMDNDGKSFRPFKFALAKFVKELLRPTWKEGHLSKEAYKTIVKNVVDKVIASDQSIHILQTKEKIDNHLATAKPKILKYLQAYVEKAEEEKSNIA